MPSKSTLYPDGSVYTVDILPGDMRKGRYDYKANDQAYDVAVVEFQDDGTFLDPTQLQAAADAVTSARERNPNGAIVVVFIHGWHHGAAWNVTDGRDTGGDEHFRAFRNVLRSLALREAERYTPNPGGRRVIGVYVGWNGDPKDSLFSSGWRSFLGFRGRYGVATTIGGGSDLRAVIKTLVARTKGRATTPQGQSAPNCPLILVGHSMGGLMIESAFLSLLNHEPQALVREPAQQPSSAVAIRHDGQLVSFPDVLIAVNSAADSSIAKAIAARLKQLNMTKEAAADGIRYSPPLLISVTSTADWATKGLWVAANMHRFWHKTDGHDTSLFTHHFLSEAGQVRCEPRGQVDHGQNWHCLRTPRPPETATPSIPIDLPLRERNGEQDTAVPHARYTLAPLGGVTSARLMWVFQVGPGIIANHNDIFNSRAASLMLALIQISGAVMSLAYDWRMSFEAEGAS